MTFASVGQLCLVRSVFIGQAITSLFPTRMCQCPMVDVGVLNVCVVIGARRPPCFVWRAERASGVAVKCFIAHMGATNGIFGSAVQSGQVIGVVVSGH